MDLTARDQSRLVGVHQHLRMLVEVAARNAPRDFVVLEGVRTLERQKALVAKGASKTLHSRHLTGHAVDLAPLENGAPSWHWPHYHELAPYIKDVAEWLRLPIEWGGDWQNFPDGPHWQLPRASYP